MRVTIDHVTIAATNLSAVASAFAELGLATEYGGAHSNGVTHMNVLGFDDGSYIELISSLASEQRSPMWDAFIVGDGGPCAWAIGTDDIAAEAARVSALGIPVQGPQPLKRTRPDGKVIEWELAFLGDGSPGATLPFLIQDKTPHEWRIQPSASVSGSELRGIRGVVLATNNRDEAVDLFRQTYGWPEPRTGYSDALSARLARFPGTPVTLAEPDGADSWLGLRLERFGPAPCAFILASDDLDLTSRRLSLGQPQDWLGHELRWIEPDRLGGSRLGVAQL